MKIRLAILSIISVGLSIIAAAQEPTFLNNSISLLRKLKVSKIIEDSTFETKVEHDQMATKFSYQERYYEYIYAYSDSLEYEEVVDSALIFINSFEVHYFNNDELVDSSFYYEAVPDSAKIDTSRILRYSYDGKGDLIRKTEITYRMNMVLTQNDYYWSAQKLDSILKYSNVTNGTFGPTYHDSIQLIEKLRLSYDSIGERLKRKILANSAKPVESYSYPNDSTVVTTQAPYHPISGCILDPTISYSSQTIFEYDKNGLIKRVEEFYRSKKENESWKYESPWSYRLSYE